eukprot:CAMPEP_0184643492 /NCGR_PEP_ID=MMETSP0308-20130426/350_1 /TAXON_ID=38269 /ORGANISM="Gloeochaete witrockiana, Strain SAG 46.84" /LENGTH=146 /DNA_ID=CAMNT_0027071475 /DNA_START=279 /DNA_END=719 /DNA_ORIENTATION=+
MDAPTDSNLHLYLKELQKHNCKHVVRVCDPTYSTDALIKEGIEVHHWPFPDGYPPPDGVINEWLSLLKGVFSKNKDKDSNETIAVHCVAGLGRAPVLVAIALIEKGMDPLEAVEYIRQRRRGAINAKQLKWLEAYKRKKKSGCIVM